MSEVILNCMVCGEPFIAPHACKGSRPQIPLTEADVRRIVREELDDEWKRHMERNT